MSVKYCMVKNSNKIITFSYTKYPPPPQTLFSKLNDLQMHESKIITLSKAKNQHNIKLLLI